MRANGGESTELECLLRDGEKLWGEGRRRDESVMVKEGELGFSEESRGRLELCMREIVLELGDEVGKVGGRIRGRGRHNGH